MYIKFEGPAITGDRTSGDHANEIEILSWSHGFVQPKMKLPSGKSVAVRSHTLDATKTLTFTTDSDTGTEKTGTMTLTCSGHSVVLEDAEITNVAHSGKSHNVSVKFASMR